jgi:hypothetical protein
MKLDDCIVIENVDNSAKISEVQMQIAQIDTQIAQRVGPLNTRKLQLQRQLATLMKQQPQQQQATQNPAAPVAGAPLNGGRV